MSNRNKTEEDNEQAGVREFVKFNKGKEKGKAVIGNALNIRKRFLFIKRIKTHENIMRSI